MHRGCATEVASIYVHAPFCARRCVYCNFAVTVRREGDLPAWCAALKAELDWVEEEERLFSLAHELETLYVGGGTPSLLGPAAMQGLVQLLGSERLASPTLEWTAEANPESFTAEVAGAWAAAGVNRISLGVQTFNADALRWMGRLHGVDGPVRAIGDARSAGIDNISVDLIFGLPATLGRSWDDDLQRVVSLDVPHVSLYGLTVEPETALGRAVREGSEQPVDEEQYREEFLRAAEVLTAAGYTHYELSNFARDGAEARHNAVYWQGAPYLGLGNGAHSYSSPVRRWNVRDWERYAARLADGRTAEDGRESVDEEAHRLERIWLDLRTSAGVASPAADSRTRSAVVRWIVDGLAREADGRVYLTPKGWLVMDRLAIEFDELCAPG
jgi:oxygen-independent coproporphyrinogen-3 oxidase